MTTRQTRRTGEAMSAACKKAAKEVILLSEANNGAPVTFRKAWAFGAKKDGVALVVSCAGVDYSVTVSGRGKIEIKVCK